MKAKKCSIKNLPFQEPVDLEDLIILQSSDSNNDSNNDSDNDSNWETESEIDDDETNENEENITER